MVGTVAEIDKNATWSIVPDKSITFTFDDQGKLGNNVALSWAMTCANDIIQGTVYLGPPLLGNPPSVPEPSTILLAGVGLAGLGFTRRRRSVR
ncbi:MAG: PEP-CTERM sorting domain-containing protein [Candidatus Competibacteraceae bacterium]|nr:PEP-CTERM sorting domain-containing protein [Candidatus Competibacteraceae bacterium]